MSLEVYMFNVIPERVVISEGLHMHKWAGENHSAGGPTAGIWRVRQVSIQILLGVLSVRI